ncbi:MAG: hypothetical protein AAF349_01110 [Cyanobacteria bacterium P01_A01_bin.68]
MSLEPKDTSQGIVGNAFANALVAGEYDVAYNMLSTSLQAELSSPELKESFESMIRYGRSAPNYVEVMSVLNDWSDKQPSDIGWAYVAICGDGFSEAVSVVVTQEETKTVISDIDWGRP